MVPHVLSFLHSFPILIMKHYDFKSKKRRERTLEMPGANTTSPKPRHRGLEHVVKEAHWPGVFRPCLPGTTECRYHECEV